MEISGTNIGAATYAMKRAMEMPNILMNLVQSSGTNSNTSQGMRNTIAQPPDLSANSSKGKRIDLVI